MDAIVLHPTSTAQWQALVRSAQGVSACSLEEDVESYLVFVLMRFVSRPEMARSVMALEFLQSLHVAGRRRQERLRDVGDQCLLFSGLFPRRADRRRVRVSYFVSLGRAAYDQLSGSVGGGLGEVFDRVSQAFVSMMEVLQAMRDLDGTRPVLEPLQALELWTDTGSGRALADLRRVTDALLQPNPRNLRH